MELISSTHTFNVMNLRYIAAVISLTLIALSIWVWVDKGEGKYSVDFVGGTEVVVKFEKPVKIGRIRESLKASDLNGAIVQAFEGGAQDFSIRLKSSHGESSDGEADSGTSTNIKTATVIQNALNTIEDNSFELLKQDYVGPIIGEKIRDDGLKAMIIAMFFILVYISVRFEWRFAVGAVVALVHDVIITTGIFVFSDKEISAAVLAALLTVIGYSINDTIIVFDRVRENITLRFKKKKGKSDAAATGLLDVLNISVSQTLSRTILTSLTTLFVVTTLWLFGGGAVADLAYALVVGIVVGTYSSIFVACTVVYALASKAGVKVTAPSAQVE